MEAGGGVERGKRDCGLTFADCRAVDLCFHLDIGPEAGRQVVSSMCGCIDTGSLFAATLQEPEMATR